jgi:Ca2+-binding RTX toxin-like protein
VLAGQSNAARAGVDNRLVELLSQTGGAYELVKTAVTGTSLFSNPDLDWDPSSGELFDDLVQNVASAVEHIRLQGHTPKIVTLWIQGEADRDTKSYGKQLEDFITQYRSSIGAPESEFFISLLQDEGHARSGQIEAADHLSNVRTIETKGLTYSDGVHYDHRSREILAEQFILLSETSPRAGVRYDSLMRPSRVVDEGHRIYVMSSEYEDFVFNGQDRPVRVASFNGDDQIRTGAGNDLISSGENDDVVAAGAGDDWIDGGANDDALDGGEGADVIEGGSGFDVLAGRDGDDQLSGGIGADRMVGGLGNDTYVVDRFQDRVVEVASAGVDKVVAHFAYRLSEHVENLTLTGSSDIDGHGNDSANVLVGNDGRNSLNGGGGSDTLEGGGGADLLNGGREVDVASFSQARGAVTVSLLIDGAQNTLSAGIDTLVSIEGLRGSAFDDWLRGDSRENLLDGGVGADVMRAGAGGDTYVVDSVADRVLEEAGEGYDIVLSTASVVLASAVEQLSLTGSQALDGTGNELANVIIGNQADNVIDGRGGSDVMSGRGGNDTYVVNDAGDVIREAAGMGSDTVQSSLSYTLSGSLENLVLTGRADLAGTGTAAANRMLGGAGNDTLRGLAGADHLDGGQGGDLMIGGEGDDNYIVDSALDRVEEVNGTGYDTVRSFVDFALSTGAERLFLVGIGNISGFGNGLANALVGNAGNNALSGGAGDDSLAGGAGSDVLRGGEGNDIYFLSDRSDLVEERGNHGRDVVACSFSYALTAHVENLTLLSDAAIAGIGNELANVIRGNAGNNLLDGRAGADTLVGGLRNDTYRVDNGGDIVIERQAEGEDSVEASASFVLPDHVEILTLVGSASIAATGNAGDNRLLGNDGDNAINGRQGADVMRGGAGNDTYFVDNIGDLLIEAAIGGTDTVISELNHELASGLENLTLSGTAATGRGNGVDNIVVGNEGADLLAGLGGNDRLDGGVDNDTLEGGDGSDVLNGGAGNDIVSGGAGSDVLTGGAGDDSYLLTDRDDLVVERSNEGRDLVSSFFSYSLTAGVEDLTLLGSEALAATGNELANVIRGNSGDNVLDGGAGADTLVGGLRNDTYRIDNSGDLVIERQAEGDDGVEASISFILPDHVEILTLIGSASIAATGNSGDNRLFGNNGDNAIDGGRGADVMRGGAGNDTYFVDNLGDLLIEASTGGTDTVISKVAFDLGDGLENLTLSGSAASGRGNGLGNVLIGNEGADLLAGLGGDDRLDGGADNDTLEGGDGRDLLNGGGGDDILIGGQGIDELTGARGKDIFQFKQADSSSRTAQADRIVDFDQEADDVVDLSGIDANASTAADEPLAFIGGGQFSGGQGQVRFEVIDGNTFVEADLNGDLVADLIIRLDGVHQLTLADFVL